MKCDICRARTFCYMREAAESECYSSCVGYVEPERTCKNKSRTALRFVCSRCEELATVYCEEDFGDVVNHSSIINYCPNCGARVV